MPNSRTRFETPTMTSNTYYGIVTESVRVIVPPLSASTSVTV